ncbi:DUF58 domain-containing protein [Halobacteria archaeon HArc-gm2]|nr:DUF58 domain-containing protein [Halobacteria archaeon HArc-gm2]
MTTNERSTDDEHGRPGAADSTETRESSAPDEQGDVRDAADADATPVESGDTVTVEEHPTERWYGVGMLALLGLGVGVLTDTAAPLLASGFGLAFAGYGALKSPPPLDLTVERTIGDPTPEPGDYVEVTVTVTNDGERSVPDLRLIDGVPDRLGVVEETPRHGAVLGPGDSTTFAYAVRAERGAFEFDGLTAVARDVSGATERVAVVGERSSLRCVARFPTDPPPFPLRAQTVQHTGRYPGDAGGAGLEFYATREYRRGDPLSRVDWNRTARTGDLTTVDFRVEQTVRVALVFDTRRSAHLAPSPHEPSAVERAVAGGTTAYASLTRAGHDVGLGAVAPVDCWLAPGQGDTHREEARHFLATHPVLSPTPPADDTNVYRATQRLKRRLTAETQVVLFSPLHDDLLADTVVRLDAHGYAVVVVSPDPTAIDTTGHLVARGERRMRIADLRSRGIPVIDWHPDEDLGHALVRTRRRWSP